MSVTPVPRHIAVTIPMRDLGRFMTKMAFSSSVEIVELESVDVDDRPPVAFRAFERGHRVLVINAIGARFG